MSLKTAIKQRHWPYFHFFHFFVPRFGHSMRLLPLPPLLLPLSLRSKRSFVTWNTIARWCTVYCGMWWCPQPVLKTKTIPSEQPPLQCRNKWTLKWCCQECTREWRPCAIYRIGVAMEPSSLHTWPIRTTKFKTASNMVSDRHGRLWEPLKTLWH